MASVLREKLNGVSFERDRLWHVTKGSFSGAITDYNWELTGYCQDMVNEFGSNIIHYGGNAYYITMEAERRGYKVEHIEDRR